MKTALFVIVALVLLFGCTAAQADTVLGKPVTGIGSTTAAIPNCPTLEGQVCYNPATGSMTFFIPLSLTKSGVYGVTNVTGGTAGTFSDSGSGTAPNTALTMFLLFAPLTLPASSASLSFQFQDLDLKYVNDPVGFFETVQFFSQGGVALTPLIYQNGQAGPGPLPFSLSYSVSGTTATQTILFPDVTSILQNPFYVQLNFTSKYTTKATNTPEKLIPILTYTAAPTTTVPEPASMLLLGIGLTGIAALRRRIAS